MPLDAMQTGKVLKVMLNAPNSCNLQCSTISCVTTMCIPPFSVHAAELTFLTAISYTYKLFGRFEAEVFKND